MKTLEERKHQLETRRAELLERMVAVESELETHNTRDWEDAATEREQDEVLEGMGLSAQSEVIRIDAALDRIETGEYGDCSICGTPISEERLDVLPFTPFCRNCAR